MSARFLTMLLACAGLPLAGERATRAAVRRRDAGLPDESRPAGARSRRIRSRCATSSKQATFIGNVKLTQGETMLQCERLVIFYDDTCRASSTEKGTAPATAQKAAGPGSQQIKRAEAKGDVFVTQKDQTARGDNGVFDVKANNIRSPATSW